MISLGLSNLIISIYLFYTKSEKESKDKESDRQLQGMKVLILDQRMKYYFETFDKLQEMLNALYNGKCRIKERIIFAEQLTTWFTEFRVQFVDLFMAVDYKLYRLLLDRMDFTNDGLVELISNEEINIVSSSFNKKDIETQIFSFRTDLLHIIYDFHGKKKNIAKSIGFKLYFENIKNKIWFNRK